MRLSRALDFNVLFVGFIITLSIPSFGISQGVSLQIDSISKLLQKEKNDTLAIRHQYALYEILKPTNQNEAKKYLDDGLRASEEINHRELHLLGLELLGFYWLDRGVADSALLIVKKARVISDISVSQKASFLVLEGRALDTKGQYYSAVEKLLEALILFESIDDGPSMANVYGNIGNVFWRMENLDKAAEYYKKGVDMSQQYDLQMKSAHLLANLGMVAKEKGQFDIALDAYLKSYEINKALGNKLDEAIDLMNIGVLYMDSEELIKARKYLTESNQLSKTVNDKVMITLSAINLAIVEEKSGNYQKELILLDMARELATELHYKPALKEIYNSYSSAYTKLGNYKAALEHQKLYEAWKDSIYNENYSNRISELEVKYESTKNQNEILSLSEENLINEAAIAQRDWWIKVLMGGVVAIVIISALTFYIFRQRTHYTEQQILFQTIAQTEVTEQSRIAKDLHDSIGSMLATLNNLLLSLTDGAPDKVDLSVIDKSTALLNQTSVEVRRIAHNMMPEELMKFGLVSALQSLLDNLKFLKLEAEFVHYGMTERIESSKEVHIFRIVQELIQNISKHAHAKKIILNLTRQENALNIMIQDDGLGFDSKQTSKGVGLMNIQSRINFLKGKFKIDSYPNQGSTIILDIPLS